MKQFDGKVLFLNKANITTSEIIPTKYLEEKDKHTYKQYIFEDLHIPGFDQKTDIPNKRIIISRELFGDGDMSEQIALAFEANGIYTIIATKFPKEFRKTMVSNNLLTIELESKQIEDIFHTFEDKETDGFIILNEDGTAKVKLISGSLSKSYHFRLGEYDMDLLENNK